MSDVPQTIDEPMAGMCAEHAWASENIPNCPLWARRCMLCGQYDSKDMNAQLKAIIEAEIAGIIGKDDKPAQIPTPLEKQLFIDYRRIDYRNQLRDQQRQRAAEAMDRLFNRGESDDK